MNDLIVNYLCCDLYLKPACGRIYIFFVKFFYYCERFERFSVHNDWRFV
jgi:hypothetical protein